MRTNTAPVFTVWPLEGPSPVRDGRPWQERIELARLAARSEALYRSAVQVFAAATSETLYKAVLSAVRSLVRVDLAALFLIQDKDGRPACRALHSGRSTIILGAAEAPTAAFADAALASSAPLMLQAPSPLLHDLPPSLNGVRSPAVLLVVPIPSGKVLPGKDGLLVAGRRMAFPFSSDQVDLLRGLADQISLALKRLRLVEAAREQERRAQELVSVASHELRTPLTALQGFSELLLSREVSRDVQKNWISLINQESLRLNSLIGELLDLTRLESGRAELSLGPVDVRELVQHVVSLWGGSGQGSRFSVRFDPGLPRLKADACKLTRVLANLVGNAVNYSPPGSPICIEVAPHCLAQPCTSHRGAAGSEAGPCPARMSIAVRDQGLGISHSDQTKVFQPFYRVASRDGESGTNQPGKPPGAGLGLTIARRLVERHGGLMWVESAPGKGCTLGFCLPSEPPDSATPDQGATR